MALSGVHPQGPLCGWPPSTLAAAVLAACSLLYVSVAFGLGVDVVAGLPWPGRGQPQGEPQCVVDARRAYKELRAATEAQLAGFGEFKRGLPALTGSREDGLSKRDQLSLWLMSGA